MSLERDQRAAVICRAREWMRTPYHHAAMVPGAGVDCAMLLVAVYRDAEVVPEVDIPAYPADWHLHRSEERYIEVLLRHCREVQTPGIGDIVVFQFGRAYSHGAIVAGWPQIIHAYIGVGCELVTDATKDGRLMGRPRRFFSPWLGRVQ